MPRFAANLTMMYQEHSFLDRFAAAARDGFTFVEYLFPYEYPSATLAAHLKQNGLHQVLFNSPPGDWKAGERGIAALPGREQEFRDGFLRALEYAHAFDCPRIHSMAGLAPAAADRAEFRAVYTSNLPGPAQKAVAKLLLAAGQGSDAAFAGLPIAGRRVELLLNAGRSSLDRRIFLRRYHRGTDTQSQ